MTFESGTRSIPGTAVGLIDDVDDRDHRVRVVFPANVTDRHGTQFAPLAFAASLQTHPHPPMLFAHRQDDPIGATIAHRIIPDGPRPRLEIVNRFDSFDANPSARRAHHGIASGSLPSFSFGFTSGEHIAHRSIPSVRVYRRATFSESSPVALGSIPGAQAIALRADAMGGLMSSTTSQHADAAAALCDAALAARRSGDHDAAQHFATSARMRAHLAYATADPTSVADTLDVERAELAAVTAEDVGTSGGRAAATTTVDLIDAVKKGLQRRGFSPNDAARVCLDAVRRWAGGAGQVPAECHNLARLAQVGITGPISAESLALAVDDAVAGQGPVVPGKPHLAGERAIPITFAKWDREIARRPRRIEVWS